MSIMGVYQADMIFPHTVTFPINISKLCVLVKYYEPLGAYDDDLELRIFLPGETNAVVTMQVPRGDLAKKVDSDRPIDADQERIMHVNLPLVLTPLVLKEEGFVKVRMVGRDRTTNLGSLLIRAAAADENITF